jgi:hypothetical protein
VWLWRYVIGWTHQKQYKIGKEENPTVICVGARQLMYFHDIVVLGLQLSSVGLLIRGFYCFLKCFLFKNIFLFLKIYF